MKRIIAVGLIAIAIGGCAGGLGLPTPKTPSQTVFELKASEGAALAVAVQYRGLPTCPTAAPICKTPNVLTSVQAADNVAAAAIDNAERLVRDPMFKDGPAALRALQAANAALVALTTITANLKVK